MSAEELLRTGLVEVTSSEEHTSSDEQNALLEDAAGNGESKVAERNAEAVGKSGMNNVKAAAVAVANAAKAVSEAMHKEHVNAVKAVLVAKANAASKADEAARATKAANKAVAAAQAINDVKESAASDRSQSQTHGEAAADVDSSKTQMASASPQARSQKNEPPLQDAREDEAAQAVLAQDAQMAKDVSTRPTTVAPHVVQMEAVARAQASTAAQAEQVAQAAQAAAEQSSIAAKAARAAQDSGDAPTPPPRLSAEENARPLDSPKSLAPSKSNVVPSAGKSSAVAKAKAAAVAQVLKAEKAVREAIVAQEEANSGSEASTTQQLVAELQAPDLATSQTQESTVSNQTSGQMGRTHIERQVMKPPLYTIVEMLITVAFVVTLGYNFPKYWNSRKTSFSSTAMDLTTQTMIGSK